MFDANFAFVFVIGMTSGTVAGCVLSRVVLRRDDSKSVNEMDALETECEKLRGQYIAVNNEHVALVRKFGEVTKSLRYTRDRFTLLRDSCDEAISSLESITHTNATAQPETNPEPVNNE